MAATDEMVRIALKAMPKACCIVPEHRREVTTEGGLNVVDQLSVMRGNVYAGPFVVDVVAVDQASDH